MCFGKAAKPPKPPPIPTPPNPTEAASKAAEDMRRRSLSGDAPRSSTVLTSPLGDAGYGANVSQPSASGTRLTLGA